MQTTNSFKYFRNALRTTLCALLFITVACNSSPSTDGAANKSPINLKHIMSLVDSVEVAGEQIMFIYIYAEAPDYKPVTATGEGITCVDDVGRLMEVLQVEIMQFGREDLVPIVAGMVRFLLYMQHEDGSWYNFMFADGSINRTHRNSLPTVGWWAARGLRGLAAAYAIFETRDPPFAETLLQQFNRTVLLLDKPLENYPATTQTPLGMRATWLPNNAPDQATEYLLALTRMHSYSSIDYSSQMKQLADGILTYQHNSPASAADGMFFCWENVWHGWGNLQALALVEAFKIQGDPNYLTAVQRWADGFLTWSVQGGNYWEVAISPDDSIATKQFNQIA